MTEAPWAPSSATPGPTPDPLAELVVELLDELGQDAHSDGLRDTPRRVAESLRELTEGYRMDPAAILRTTFAVTYDEMVVVRGIEFWSLCEHHMLPFHGVVTVGYLPDERVVGLSKIPRLVACFARRLQIQERLTQQIAESMQENLNPLGVGVVVQATHTCMAMRGIRVTAPMITSSLLGRVREDPRTRAEFLALANGGH